MSKIYDVETDPALVEFCLNCKQKRCIGNCEALKQEKERHARINKAKKTNKKGVK